MADALSRWEDEGGARVAPPPSHGGCTVVGQYSSADVQELRRALVVCRQELAAARRQIGELEEEKRCSDRQLTLLQRKASEASQFAVHDVLTGLPNRRLLLDRFSQAVKRAKRQHNQVLVLFLDLDGFKHINDSLGHRAGDKLLQQVAARLTACIRTSDTACRYGGDEFIVLLPEFTGHSRLSAIAEKIRVHLAMPYLIDRVGIKLTVSVGTAVYPLDGNQLDDLVGVSDRAMYRCKGRRRVAPSIFRLQTRVDHD